MKNTPNENLECVCVGRGEGGGVGGVEKSRVIFVVHQHSKEIND